MKFHDNPAVLHYVIFAVVFFVLKKGEERVLSMVFRAGLRSVITICPRAKMCFTQSQQCIMSMKIFNSTLGIIKLKFGVNG